MVGFLFYFIFFGGGGGGCSYDTMIKPYPYMYNCRMLGWARLDKARF